MTAEIKAFPGTSDPQRPPGLQPSAEVIGFLKELLMDAESGKLRAIAVATVAEGDMVAFGWVHGGGPTSHSLMAAVSDLAFEFAAKRRDDRSCAYRPPVPGA